jgi:hypothetical protein
MRRSKRLEALIYSSFTLRLLAGFGLVSIAPGELQEAQWRHNVGHCG